MVQSEEFKMSPSSPQYRPTRRRSSVTKTIQNAIAGGRSSLTMRSSLALSSSLHGPSVSPSGSDSEKTFTLPNDAKLSIHELMELLKEIGRLHRGDYFDSRECGLPSRSGHGSGHSDQSFKVQRDFKDDDFDENMIDMVASYVEKLEQTHHIDDLDDISDDDKDQIATLLESFVWYPNLRCKYARNKLLVADLHSHVGLLRQSICARQGNNDADYDQVIKPLTKALLLYKKSSRVSTNPNGDTRKDFTDPDRIALASHRLGLAYAQAGCLVDAVTLLQQAVEFYKRKKRFLVSVCLTDHPLMVAAKRELKHCENGAFIQCNPDNTDDIIAIVD